MSFQIMAWAVQQKVGNATGKAVLLMLANYCDQNGECFPSQKTLADDCECGVRTIARWLDQFEADGLISRSHRQRADGSRTSDYVQIIHSANVAVRVKSNMPQSQGLHATKSGPTCQSDRANEPITEPVIEPITKELTQFDELSKALDAEHANAVIAHRKNFKAKFTPYAAKLLANKFLKCEDPNAAADTMIGNGWQGFEPDWVNKPTRASPPNGKPSMFGVLDTLVSKMENSHDSLQFPQSGDRTSEVVRYLPTPERQR